MKSHIIAVIGVVFLVSCVPQEPEVEGPMPESFLDIEECKELAELEQQRCYDNFIMKLAKSGKDTGAMLADMEWARTQSDWVENECHPMVHAIGRWTLKTKGTIGDAFEACDQSCHSGCYHGAMERLFFAEENLEYGINHLSMLDMERVVPTLCSKDKFSDPTQQVIFQCLHGGGHAILYSIGYDLELGLAACDLFPTQYDRSSCYGGMFMENVTAYDKSLRDLKEGDPLYPCNKLEDKYVPDCLSMQTSIMFEFGMRDKEIAETCATLEKYADKCFISLGRDLSNDVRIDNAERTRKACEDYSGDFAGRCVEGALYALIDNTWDGEFAYQYCDVIQGDALQKDCFGYANDYLRWAYNFEKVKLLEHCVNLAGKNEKLCRDSVLDLAAFAA